MKNSTNIFTYISIQRNAQCHVQLAEMRQMKH